MVRKAMDQPRIVSNSSAAFADHEEAGRLLAVQIREHRGQGVVVFGIPRGGIVVARKVARSLGAKLDIIPAHKQRIPGHEELTMGSVGEDGKLFLNLEIVGELGMGEAYIQEEKARHVAEIKRYTELLHHVRPKVAWVTAHLLV